ncbi:ribosome biogenesis GTPase YlqF [Mycoplasma bovis]|uniref:Ribosome biogenesis GTPase A n=1 Tax=Mycoplasmopsis bovis (strain ATCC 25523 / DSM 22781 / NCTC 10131 / PG45) TaxID=289397 RepID=A0A454AQM5_MYCBG|nr:ribosome biogenesis GTPase YlqF [Mycoplasmopsis bovis]ADR25343.1 GTP-binding protein [Mycoplasmopsis bovis PG45]MBT1368362.1 ribosome biogenesis GTPase YlqF [Mycoplasmopsis bovis]QLI75940.1 ribosome biogenesis GTPase YlqF [Mycoplasmopsis bovis]TKA60085.1 GTP-binding protein [Mycoplasmopsis bovis 1067]UTW26277.1 ribosome biogenesis GTPase YlqF [Mycoplasmopsis bovis]
MNNDTENQQLINWYPGHMAKGMREIKENASLADVFIIVLDARCPISSYNEDFDSISPSKPRLFIITKSDLMDVSKKATIEKRFGSSMLLWLDLRNPKSKNIIINKLKKITESKVAKDKQKGLINSRIKAFVMGIPNAGKSTLINLVSNKKSLQVANYPGVTRAKKWVTVDNFFFMDTPGILLPKLTDQYAATKLAMIGSIETNIFPQKFLFTNFLKVLADYYPKLLIDEFKLTEDDLSDLNEVKTYNILTKIAVLKGYVKNNKYDFNKTYTFFINWVRNLKGVTFD